MQKLVSKATFRKPEMREVHILQNLTGVLRPGRIALLVGPPSGGKSIFMKARLLARVLTSIMYFTSYHLRS